MPTSSLRCPGCGAPADSDAARCDYCGAALATVTCASCFAPMFAGARFCAHCGAEAVRERVDEAKPLKCPRCREDTQALRLGGTVARECAQCGGLWLDLDALDRLTREHDELVAATSILAARIAVAPTPTDVVRYVPCPVCGKLMNRTNFAHASGVILDVCKGHGVWLDRGELQRVMDFVESGGLAVARDRERVKLAEEQRRLEMMKATAAVGAPPQAGFEVNIRQSSEKEVHVTRVLGLLIEGALGLVMLGNTHY
jgi:Zn-finger nucleic acid-binding protein